VRTVAAFDFDGTLTRRDSLVPFLGTLVGWPRTLRALARVAPMLRDRDAAKELLLAGTLRGISYERVAQAGERYGRELARAIRPEMRERLGWHRAERHDIVIVSASLDVYLEATARELAVDALLCTRVEVDDHGYCTGRMLGGNCRGETKAARLREYLGSADATLYAYGDSSGDDAMLAMADHPVRYRRRVARTR